jgi:hypothetical protein
MMEDVVKQWAYLKRESKSLHQMETRDLIASVSPLITSSGLSVHKIWVRSMNSEKWLRNKPSLFILIQKDSKPLISSLITLPCNPLVTGHGLTKKTGKTNVLKVDINPQLHSLTNLLEPNNSNLSNLNMVLLIILSLNPMDTKPY